ncbi:MAG: hypothetical protein K2W96_22320 [Gemmataceae bacterium]|nr:hypothetical protein [Gemmataceae bacterium]
MRAAWLAVLLAGCGLAEYEKKMQDAEERSARFDEYAKALALPLDLPRPDPKKKDAAPLPMVTLRPPKGIPTQPAKEPRAGVRWAYLPPNATIAAPFGAVELAFGKPDDKEFHARLLATFDGKPGPAIVHKAKPPGRKETEFVRTVIDAGDYEWSVNTHRGVAVVFLWAKAQGMAARKTADLSLETFAEGPESHRVRTQATTGGPLGTVPR